MPWGRLDDGLYDHPKLHELGRDRLPAIGLWTLAVSWCNRRLTDGYVPAKRVGLLGGSRRLAQRLVEVGLFEVDGTDYLVHDFLDFNDSREQVLTRREAAAERQRRHRTNGADVTPSSQRESQRDKQRDTEVGHGVTEALVTAPTRAPTRVRPGPTRHIPVLDDDSPISPQSGDDGKVNPRANGTNPRATGDSPRQRAQAIADQAAAESKARRYRAGQRHLAYTRGTITEAELGEMNARDASLDELPDWQEHQQRIAIEANL